MKRLATAFLYWVATESLLARFVAFLGKRRVFDGKGWVSVPADAPANVVSSIFFHVYERPERKMVRQWLPNSLDCIELGASIGVVSREIIGTLSDQQRLLAFEAVPDLALLAGRNIGSLGSSCRYTVVQKAISYSGGTVTFSQAAEHIGGRVTDISDAASLTVSATQLSAVLADYEIGPFSLVMDIEGMEYELLEHDAAGLEECRCLIVELHGNSHKKDQFLERVLGLGFVLSESKHNVYALSRLRFK